MSLWASLKTFIVLFHFGEGKACPPSLGRWFGEMKKKVLDSHRVEGFDKLITQNSTPLHSGEGWPAHRSFSVGGSLGVGGGEETKAIEID